MTREEKTQVVENLTAVLEGTSTVYITDISGLDAGTTADLRRACFKANVKMSVVKKLVFLWFWRSLEGLESSGRPRGRIST